MTAEAFKASLTNPFSGVLGEHVHIPGEHTYDVARQTWNLAADLHPAAVVRPGNVTEVAAVVRAAVRHGLRVAPISTGHGAAAMSERDLSDTVLVKLDRLTGVTVDPQARTARVVGGTLWQDVVAAAAPYGLTALHGSAGDVAVAGFVLSGGLSFYGRRHGLSANSVRAVELIDATGELRKLSADREPELFWAVRGGVAGNLGVVVAIELDLVPYADVHAGMLLFPIEEAPRVVPAWRDWTATAPETATTSLRLMSFPPLPDLPPFLSGRRLVVIDGAVLEDDDRAAEVLAPLRALGAELDTFGRIPAAGMLAVHMDPPAPVPSVGDHRLLSELSDKAVDELLEVALSSESLLFTELRHVGGAFGRPAAGGGVLSHLDGEFALFALAMAFSPEMAEAGQTAATAVCRAMEPWASGRCAPTFSDLPTEGPELWGESWVRLRHAVATVDPGEVFVANHRVR